MSKFYLEYFLEGVGIDDSASAVRFALGDLSMRLVEASSSKFVAKESLDLGGIVWPAKVSIELVDKGNGVLVCINTSNFSFGPIQTNHVKKVSNNVLSSVRANFSARSMSNSSEQSSLEIKDASGQMSLSAEIQKLQELREKGVLSENEFIIAKKRLLD